MKLTLDEALERLSFGRFQVRLLLLCGAIWAAVAMDVLVVSFALPSLRQEWALSPTQAGLLASATFWGMLVGAWFWGIVADRVGRRRVLAATIIVENVFTLLSALAPSFPVVVAMRALIGFGMGGALPADYTLFAEFLPVDRRGRNLVLMEGFWAIGALATAGLAWAVVPKLGWRPLFALAALPGILAYCVLRYVPESPRFLLVHGQAEQAWKVLARIARANGRDFPQAELILPAGRPARVRALWERRYARTTALLWLIWFGISLGYYGVFTWLPQILVERQMGFLRSHAYMVGITLAQIPGYISAAYFVERLGRRPTLGLYLLASGIFTLLFGLAQTLWAFLLMAVGMSFFALGSWGALYAYTPEVYPTQLRATGMGAASAMTRVAGLLAPLLGGLLLATSLPLALTVFASAFGVCGLAALALPYETRGKRLLDLVG